MKIIPAPPFKDKDLGTHMDAFGIKGYSVEPDRVSWIYCREIADDHCYDRGVHGYFYTYNTAICPVKPEDAFENLDRWFKQIKETTKFDTEVCKTTNEKIGYIHFGKDWFQSKMYMSLASILVRAGIHAYEGKSMSEVLSHDTYAMRTFFAVKRFLDGYTHYCGYGNKWVDTFNNVETEHIEKAFISPREVEKRAYQKWKDAGCPFGKDKEFWKKACSELRYGGMSAKHNSHGTQSVEAELATKLKELDNARSYA